MAIGEDRVAAGGRRTSRGWWCFGPTVGPGCRKTRGRVGAVGPARAAGHGLRGAGRASSVTGLYTSILCLLGYAIFGPSRVLVLGPDSALGPMIAATILPLVLPGRPRAGGRPRVAACRARRCADHGRPAARSRSGFVADLLSKPTQIGYMNGLARHHRDRAAAQAVRVLRRCRRLPGRGAERSSTASRDGETVTASLAIGVAPPGPLVMPRAAAVLAEVPERRARRGGRLDRGRLPRIRPRRSRRRPRRGRCRRASPRSRFPTCTHPTSRS